MYRKIKFRYFLLLVPLLVMPVGTSASADISAETIKATYIVQIQKFISFGEPPRSVKKICYYEEDKVPFSESVGQQVEKYASTHPEANFPVVKRLDAIRDMGSCDILFIPASAEGDVDNIITALGNADTLTISGAPRFTMRGGVMGFVLDESSRIKMEVNMKNAKARNIHIDSQLLELMQRSANP